MRSQVFRHSSVFVVVVIVAAAAEAKDGNFVRGWPVLPLRYDILRTEVGLLPDIVWMTPLLSSVKFLWWSWRLNTLQPKKKHAKIKIQEAATSV